MRPALKPAALRRCAIPLICLFIASASKPAKADPFGDNIGAQIVLTGVIIGAVAGVAIYLLVRKGPSITGCAISDATGLQLRDDQNHLDYKLLGGIAAIRPGNKVRVYGRRQKTAAGYHQFLVRKQPKYLGPCIANL